MANDAAQQRALPISRHAMDRSDTVASQTECSVSGWGNTDDSQNDTPQDIAFKGTPRFQPSKLHAELLRKDSIREPVFGSRSKNQQLGSVAESWGAPPALDIPKGMFELEDDPPSPIEGKEMSPAEIKEEKARRAALGIPAEKSGRASIKDMEKERMDKMKHQRLWAERGRNGAESL